MNLKLIVGIALITFILIVANIFVYGKIQEKNDSNINTVISNTKKQVKPLNVTSLTGEGSNGTTVVVNDTQSSSTNTNSNPPPITNPQTTPNTTTRRRMSPPMTSAS